MNRLKTLSRLGHGANDMYFFILPASLPLILQEYGFSYTAAGAFVTIYLCAIAVMSFVMGRLADRISRAILIVGGFYLASTALIFAGLAPSFPVFMVLAVFAAAGASTYHPVMYATIDEGIAFRRGRMYARFELFGAAGVLLLLLFNGLLADRIGWRNVVLVACAPGLIVGTLILANRSIFRTAHAASGTSPPSGDTGDTAVIDRPAPDPAEEEPAPTAPPRGAAAGRNTVVLFFAGIVLRTITATAIVNFMPTYLARGAGLDVSLGAFASGLVFVGAMIANTFIGDLADRYGPDRILVVASLSAGVFLFLSTLTATLWLLPLSLLALGASISGAIPAQNLMLSSLSPEGRKGATFGTLMGVTTVANSLGPLALGAIADRIGLASTFRFASLPVIVSCVLVYLVAKSEPVRRLRLDVRRAEAR